MVIAAHLADLALISPKVIAAHLADLKVDSMQDSVGMINSKLTKSFLHFFV